MKQIYFTLSLLLICSLSFAQKNFQSGFIVQNGDTVQGLVDYRGGVRSSQLTTFKQNESAAEQTFSPDNIQGYGFYKEQKLFESHSVPATAEEGTATQRLFLNVLVKGKANLYHYRDAFQKERYYISKDNGPLVELTQVITYKTDATTGRKRRVTDKTFVTALSSVASDCAALSPAELKRVNLNHTSLTAAVFKYNQCVNPASVSYAQEKKKGHISIAPVAAYFVSNLTTTGPYILANREYDNSLSNFTGGISLNFTIPAINEKLSIQTDLLYTPYKFTSYQVEENGSGRQTSSEVTFDLGYLKLPAQLRYTFPKGKIRPFINAGPVLAYAVKFKDKEVIQSTFMSSSYTEEGPALPEYIGSRKYALGLTSGIGLSYPVNGNALSIEARYEINDGFSAISEMTTRIKSSYFILSYAF
ncbi:outer membrane beta-barrel protein [uncultured Pontibacter sp.]|uniref:outer membrane beta-barrel protein n=1 Tax=uncultured Pontibacter sp. TaxID=453356 RepID=UPI0026312D54|nr:outer membrane beta-barrel protein [uncultured Pontibacter sp.]